MPHLVSKVTLTIMVKKQLERKPPLYVTRWLCTGRGVKQLIALPRFGYLKQSSCFHRVIGACLSTCVQRWFRWSVSPAVASPCTHRSQGRFQLYEIISNTINVMQTFVSSQETYYLCPWFHSYIAVERLWELWSNLAAHLQLRETG